MPRVGCENLVRPSLEIAKAASASTDPARRCAMISCGIASQTHFQHTLRPRCWDGILRSNENVRNHCCSTTTLLRRIPMPSISTSNVSPGCMA
jgi:hypothetical protein